MTAQASSAPQGGRRRAAALARFEPLRLPLLLLVLKGWALSVLTVGAYRFWAAADLRAFLWRTLSLAGERLEYDGRPVDALVRSLVEFAVAFPILAVFLTAVFMLGDAGFLASLALLAAAVVTLSCLRQMQAFRVRQYLLSHTLWRGIRGGLDGSVLAFAAVVVAGWFGVVATLGLAYPWMRLRRWAYLINRARFGNRHFTFEPSGGPPLGAWLVVWLGVVATLIGFAAVNQEALVAIVDGWGAGFPAADAPPPLSFLPMGALILPAIFFVRYRVLEFRHIADCISLGRSSLESTLPAGTIMIAVVLHWILVLVGAGLALLMLNRTAIEAAEALRPVGILTPLGLGLILIAYLSTVKTLWLRCEVVRTLCRTLLINDAPALQALEQHGGSIPRRFRRSAAAALAAEEA